MPDMAANGLSSAQIPVIDISSDGDELGEELVGAVVKWGFVFIHGNALGFDSHVIDDAFELVTNGLIPNLT